MPQMWPEGEILDQIGISGGCLDLTEAHLTPVNLLQLLLVMTEVLLAVFDQLLWQISRVAKTAAKELSNQNTWKNKLVLQNVSFVTYGQTPHVEPQSTSRYPAPSSVIDDHRLHPEKCESFRV